MLKKLSMLKAKEFQIFKICRICEDMMSPSAFLKEFLKEC